MSSDQYEGQSAKIVHANECDPSSQAIPLLDSAIGGSPGSFSCVVDESNIDGPWPIYSTRCNGQTGERSALDTLLWVLSTAVPDSTDNEQTFPLWMIIVVAVGAFAFCIIGFAIRREIKSKRLPMPPIVYDGESYSLIPTEPKVGKEIKKYSMPEAHSWRDMHTYYSQFVTFEKPADTNAIIVVTTDGSIPDPSNPKHRVMPGSKIPLVFTNPKITIRAQLYRKGSLFQPKATSVCNTLVLNEPIRVYVPEITRADFPSNIVVMTALVGEVWFTDDGTIPQPHINGTQYDSGNAYTLSVGKPGTTIINAVAHVPIAPTSSVATAKFVIQETHAPSMTRDPITKEIKISASPYADITYSVRNGADIIKATCRSGKAIVGIQNAMRPGVTTVGAQAFEPGHAPSRLVTKEFVVRQCAAPVIQAKRPSTRVNDGSIQILISGDSGQNADIYFSTRHKSSVENTLVPPKVGAVPHGELFDSKNDLPTVVPLLDDPVVVEAYCVRDGWIASKCSRVEVYPQQIVDMPQITVDANMETDDLTIGIVCKTRGAKIYFTLDGSQPKAGVSQVYTSPLVVNVDELGGDGNPKIRAIASCAGMLNSEEAVVSILDFDKCAMPCIRTNWSNRTHSYMVTALCATHDATLHYTIDNEDIKGSAIMYNSNDKPILKPESAGSGKTIIRARATKSGFIPSEVCVYVQGIERNTPKPSIIARYKSSNQPDMELVMYVNLDRKAKIYYTLDGSEVTYESNVYDPSNPPVITPEVGGLPIPLKAFAVSTSSNPSPVVEILQDVVRTVPTPEISVIPYQNDSDDVELRRGVSGNNVTLVITCPNYPDAEIEYTVDGSDVTNGGSRYYDDNRPLISQPDAGSAPLAIQAIARLDYYNPSKVAIKSIQLVAQPEIKFDSISDAKVRIQISCKTPGTTIFYCLGNVDVYESSSTYDICSPVIADVPAGGTAHILVQAYATKDGCDPSQVATKMIEAVSAPIFNVCPTNKKSYEVTLNCTTQGSQVYYSIDGDNIVENKYEVELEAFTSLNETSATTGEVNVQFKIEGEWSEPQGFFRHASQGSEKRKSFLGLQGPPTALRLSLVGEDSNSWNFWKLLVNGVQIISDSRGLGGSPYGTQPFWLATHDSGCSNTVEIALPDSALTMRRTMNGLKFLPTNGFPPVVPPATIQACAIKPGWLPSPVTIEQIKKLGQVAKPVIKPIVTSGASYRIVITCSTKRASIFYSISDPKHSQTLLQLDKHIFEDFSRLNRESSDNYLSLGEINAEDVDKMDLNQNRQISVLEYMKSQHQDIVKADEHIPEVLQYQRTSPPEVIPIHGSAPIVIKAWAKAPGLENSAESTFELSCTRSVPTPKIQLKVNSSKSSTEDKVYDIIIRSSMDDVNIYYTVNNADILQHGILYSPGVHVRAPAIDEDDVKVEAYATRKGFKHSSIVAVEVPHQHVEPELSMPIIDIKDTEVVGTYAINVKCKQPGVQIYLALNGSDVRTHGILYKDSVPTRISILPKRTHPHLNDKTLKLFEAISNEQAYINFMTDIENASKIARNLNLSSIRSILQETLDMFDLDGSEETKQTIRALFAALDCFGSNRITFYAALAAIHDEGLIHKVLTGARRKDNFEMIQCYVKAPGCAPSDVLVANVTELLNSKLSMQTRVVKERLANTYKLNKELTATKTTLVDQQEVERKKVVNSPTIRLKHIVQAMVNIQDIQKQLSGKVSGQSSLTN